MTTRPQAYTVSAVTRIIKETLESTLQGVWVEGEVSNYLHHGSGHRYLNLKDDRATLKVTIWRSAGKGGSSSIYTGRCQLLGKKREILGQQNHRSTQYS